MEGARVHCAVAGQAGDIMERSSIGPFHGHA